MIICVVKITVCVTSLCGRSFCFRYDMEFADSRDKLFAKQYGATKLRILAGFAGLLAIAVIGLIVAIVVVSNNNDNSNNNKDEINSGGQTDGQTGCLKVPDCPLNPESETPELDKANCILDSYPLIDG